MTDNNFIQQLLERNKNCCGNFPDKELTEQFIDDLFTFLFASYREKDLTEASLLQRYQQLKSTFEIILLDLLKSKEPVENNARIFFEVLPVLYHQLIKDANATLEFDPAATSIEEVLVAYPGFYATAVHRIAHQLHKQKIPTLPRLLSEYAHSKTGIDIHPAATIGERFTIDHGTGIVIGETTIIGNNVKIYQGVTLGALNVTKANATKKRHPTIQDNVVIYSGATILGGKTVIGHDATIGGNVWLTNSVEPYSIVYHKSEITVKGSFDFSEVLNFVI
ncbi:serine O-acetyltransferase EpsC [Parasediminibacterium paludis]|uniref:Serine O-acetyltransferase EpsC n=1 Tax=Parasediminibacterium paludis TaxID=908966 RepID=A0ABV8PUW7_9BACT